jgi:hypothetical protein
MTDTSRRSGACLCGDVQYSTPSEPLAVAICHCRDCQRQSGSAFSLIAAFPRDQVQIDGDCAEYQTIGASGNDVARRFCGRCGSPLFSETKSSRESGLVFIKAGTLDKVDDLIPTAHFWTASKQPWVEISDHVYTVDRE